MTQTCSKSTWSVKKGACWGVCAGWRVSGSRQVCLGMGVADRYREPLRCGRAASGPEHLQRLPQHISLLIPQQNSQKQTKTYANIKQYPTFRMWGMWCSFDSGYDHSLRWVVCCCVWKYIVHVVQWLLWMGTLGRTVYCWQRGTYCVLSWLTWRLEFIKVEQVRKFIMKNDEVEGKEFMDEMAFLLPTWNEFQAWLLSIVRHVASPFFDRPKGWNGGVPLAGVARPLALWYGVYMYYPHFWADGRRLPFCHRDLLLAVNRVVVPIVKITANH